jgi:hypothetical protein
MTSLTKYIRLGVIFLILRFDPKRIVTDARDRRGERNPSYREGIAVVQPESASSGLACPREKRNKAGAIPQWTRDQGKNRVVPYAHNIPAGVEFHLVNTASQTTVAIAKPAM